MQKKPKKFDETNRVSIAFTGRMICTMKRTCVFLAMEPNLSDRVTYTDYTRCLNDLVRSI